MRFLPFFLLLISGIGTCHARAICVFDMAGSQGPVMNSLKEYTLAAQGRGVSLSLRAYTDERVAAEDFKAGQCEGVLVSGVRARQFTPFAGSIDSVGALPDYPSLKMLVQTLARPEAATLMRNGTYETAGILPLGAAFLFIRDRRIDSVARMAGKRLAVLEHDRAQFRMAERIGAQAVSADVSTFAGKFNNGVVDVVVAPGIAYMPLELYKGVGTRGVVVKLPAAQLTLQLVLRHTAFPEGFAQFSRDYFLGQFDATLAVIREAEDSILYFFPPPDGDEEKYRDMMREARITLTTEGIYDRRMMAIMKKVRCRRDPGHAECSDGRE